ncbi:MAG: hypothetical protein K8F91_17785, partial [Candidatus Obscuribacterales bacterium]|nr:hypothetical protein [Candidatus Obscuribacterales bacterium]
MRNKAKERGLPTAEIDRFAQETLINPAETAPHAESQHEAGTFKAINPNERLIAQIDGTLDPPVNSGEKKLDASKIVADSIATGWKGPRYSFSPIYKDITPQAKYRLKPDDTYESIAKDQLGTGASEAELKTYMQEIHEINGYPGQPEPFRSPTSDFVRLPGHNKNGDLILQDNDESSITTRSDGIKKFLDKDGTSAAIRKTNDGGVIETHKGPPPQDNYSIFVTADGTAFEQDAEGKWSPIEDSETDFRVQILRLTDSAFEKMTLKEVQDLRRDSKRFHQRFQEFLNGWMTPRDQAQPGLVEQNQTIAAQEVARTLRIAADTLKAPNDKLPVDHDLANRPWRGKLISQALDHAADPASIDQGSQAVCGIAALEARLYTRNPSAALELISTIALTGKFELKHPPQKAVYLDQENNPTLVPDAESESYESDKSEDSSRRSYASQVFESTAINIGLQNRGDKSNFFYVNTVNPINHGDNRENNRRGYYVPVTADIKDHSKYINLKEANADNSSVGITEVEELGIYRQITGKDESYFYIVAGQGSSKDNLRENGTAMLWKPEELPNMLLKLKQLNLFPGIASVDSSVSPIINQWRASGLSGTPTGRHAITIPEISESGSQLAIDNFWGKKADNTKLDRITGKFPIHTSQLAQCILSNSKVSVDSKQLPDERPGA